MVERILNAGRVTLIERGYEGASTNRIAAAAGISPGSLYQYFANKEAVIAAVVDRYGDQIAARVTAHLSTQIGGSGERERIRETIGTLLDSMAEQPELLRALIEQTPRLGLGYKAAAFEDRVGELAMAHVRLRSVSVGSARTTIWLLVRAVEHLTIRYLLDRPPIDRDEFLDEITTLVTAYINAGAQ